MSNLKFLLDEDIYLDCSKALKIKGIDAIHVQEAERKGYSDISQLEFAISQERCIVTFNKSHFIQLAEYYAINDLQHFGIIVSSKIPIKIFLQRLQNIHLNYSSESMINYLIYI
jgi:predicted nuclease of predicted toxin-antitoxin system